MAIWAFLSDIHGNYAALERAVALARARGAVRFAFLGDLLGRGDSDRCVELIRQVADLSVVGNRDLDWRDRVSQASRAYVLSLPRLAEAEDFLAVHGSPDLTPGLGSRDVRSGLVGAYQRLTQSGRRHLFFGHTHYARVWQKDGLAVEPVQIEDKSVQFEAVPSRVYVVNVGTVGLPFPGKGPPSFVLYDTAESRIEQVTLPRDEPRSTRPGKPDQAR